MNVFSQPPDFSHDPSAAARHLPYVAGEDNVSPYSIGGVVRLANRGGPLLLCVFLLFNLTACKIDLKIFGTGTVESDSGSMACSNNDPDSANQSGDCSQEYVTVITDCEGYGVPDHDEWAELPNCTLVTTEAPITETLLASPSEDDSFDGWDGDCLGAGNCEITVDAGDADDQEAVMTVEAHFDEEPAPQDAIYTYNYLGQRASKTVNGIITYFVYDEAGNLLSEIDGNNSTPNNIKSRKNYVYLEGEYVAHVEYTGDVSNEETQAQIFYPLNDHLGQPIAMLRADANISHEQYTDPFGKMHAQYLNTGVGTGPEPQNKKLPGQYLDRETGYHDNHMRTYFPDASIYSQPDWLDVLGRTNDPQLAIANMMGAVQLPQYMAFNHSYQYANQDPINKTDPDGLNPQIPMGGIGGVPNIGGNGTGGALGTSGGAQEATYIRRVTICINDAFGTGNDLPGAIGNYTTTLAQARVSPFFKAAGKGWIPATVVLPFTVYDFIDCTCKKPEEQK